MKKFIKNFWSIINMIENNLQVATFSKEYNWKLLYGKTLLNDLESLEDTLNKLEK